MQENKGVFKVQTFGLRDLINPQASNSTTTVTKSGSPSFLYSALGCYMFYATMINCAAYGEQHKGADKFQT